MAKTSAKNLKGIEKTNFISILLSIYIFFIGVGLPLVVRDKYFDILIFKYYYYSACTIVMLLLLLAYSLLTEKGRINLFAKVRIRIILNGLTWSDYSALFFYLIAIISTVTSDYVYESFWGNEGRYTGLFLITLYVISYFCISKFWKFHHKYIDYIVYAGMIVCIFGIMDYFKLDVLGFKALMQENQKNIFTSTIGNINTYTAYVGMIVAMASVLFATETSVKRSLFYYVCMIIGFFALIMGISDNAYLSIGALFGILPFVLFKNSRGVRGYIVVIATFLSVIQCISWINIQFQDRVIGLDSSFNIIAELKGLTILIVILWTIAGIWFIYDFYNKNIIIEFGNTLRYCWLCLLMLLIVGLLYIIIDCNFFNNVSKYGKIASFILLNDDWGTHRGYIWRNAMECYFKLPLWHKLVGYGPETLGILLLQKTAHNSYNEIFDNAHNEYLQLLVTTGVLGLISYLSFIISLIKKGIQQYAKDYHVVAVIVGIICYSSQAMVNLNLPIVTPLFWILLAMISAKQNDNLL